MHPVEIIMILFFTAIGGLVGLSIVGACRASKRAARRDATLERLRAKRIAARKNNPVETSYHRLYTCADPKCYQYFTDDAINGGVCPNCGRLGTGDVLDVVPIVMCCVHRGDCWVTVPADSDLRAEWEARGSNSLIHDLGSKRRELESADANWYPDNFSKKYENGDYERRDGRRRVDTKTRVCQYR